MASKDDIVFLSATVPNKPKSNHLGDFVAKNRTTDLGLDIKKEKVYEVINFFSNFLFLIFLLILFYNSSEILPPLAKRQLELPLKRPLSSRRFRPLSLIRSRH